MVPNHFGSYEKKQNGIEVVRFYPTEKIVETKTQQEYENTIHELGRIIRFVYPLSTIPPPFMSRILYIIRDMIAIGSMPLRRFV